FQAEDGIRDDLVTGVQTCALPIWPFRNDSRRTWADNRFGCDLFGKWLEFKANFCSRSAPKTDGHEAHELSHISRIHLQHRSNFEIGRASCREIVSMSVSVVC